MSLRALERHRQHQIEAKSHGWFVYFRLDAPLQPLFDKTFTLPDLQRLD